MKVKARQQAHPWLPYARVRGDNWSEEHVDDWREYVGTVIHTERKPDAGGVLVAHVLYEREFILPGGLTTHIVEWPWLSLKSASAT